MVKPKKISAKELQGQQFHRALHFDRADVNEEDRTIEVAFASEDPYLRWWGYEIIDTKSMDLDKLNTGAAVLVNHDWDAQVGVVESARVDDDLRGRAVLRFGKSARAQEIFDDIRDGIRRHISFGYEIKSAKELEDKIDGVEAFRVEVLPFEISTVSVPADFTVGVGRSFDPDPVIKGDKALDAIREAAASTPILNLTITDITEGKPMSDDKKTPEVEPVDVDAIEAKAVNRGAGDERKRIIAIRDMGEQFQKQELAQAHIEKGTDVDAFQRILLDALKLEPVPTPVSTIPAEDAREFSFVRLMRHMADPNDKRAREAAGFEREMCEVAPDRPQASGLGYRIPHEVLNAKRDLSVGGTNYGSSLVGTDHLASSFIELLRNSLVTRQAGARILSDLQGNVAIPRQSGGATWYWVAEDGSITESDQTFDQVTMSPKTGGALSEMTRKLLIQSSPDVEMLVRSDLAQVAALGIDYAALFGNPDLTATPNTPRGVAYTSGIGSVAGGTNGAAPTRANIISLWQEVAKDNAAAGSLSYITNSSVVGKLANTKVDTGSGEFILNNLTDGLFGYPVNVSEQVPSNLTKGSGSSLSAILFGNWNDLIIGMWSGLDIIVDPYTASASGRLRIVVFQDVDVAVRHPQSFSAMLDAITT